MLQEPKSPWDAGRAWRSSQKSTYEEIVETYVQNQIEVVTIEVSSTKAGC